MSGRPRFLALRGLVAAVGLAGLLAAPLGARETPKSHGPPSNGGYPILRVPKTSNPPAIDGRMKPGEWEDASALSSFWHEWSGGYAQDKFLAPDETQVEAYAA